MKSHPVTSSVEVFDLDDDQHGRRPTDPADISSDQDHPRLTAGEAEVLDDFAEQARVLAWHQSDDRGLLSRVEWSVALLRRRCGGARTRRGQRRHRSQPLRRHGSRRRSGVGRPSPDDDGPGHRGRRADA